MHYKTRQRNVREATISNFNPLSASIYVEVNIAMNPLSAMVTQLECVLNI